MNGIQKNMTYNQCEIQCAKHGAEIGQREYKSVLGEQMSEESIKTILHPETNSESKPTWMSASWTGNVETDNRLTLESTGAICNNNEWLNSDSIQDRNADDILPNSVHKSELSRRDD